MRLRQHNYVRTNPRLKILFIKLTLLVVFRGESIHSS